MLGAGRDRVDAAVDPSAGIDVVAPPGSAVRAGEPVLRLACADRGRVPAARALLDQGVEFGDTAAAPRPLIIGRIGPESGA